MSNILDIVGPEYFNYEDIDIEWHHVWTSCCRKSVWFRFLSNTPELDDLKSTSIIRPRDYCPRCNAAVLLVVDEERYELVKDET